MLSRSYGVRKHPIQLDAYVIEDIGLPFYAPKNSNSHVFVMGFNKLPLSEYLLHALIENEELAPNSTEIIWTQEQELILKSTLGDLREAAKTSGNP